MDRQDLIRSIRAYRPHNAQEEKDRVFILSFLEREPEVFSRTSAAAHMTASAWVVNKDRTRVLMAYHRLYDSWSWLGGHADGEEDLLKAACREVQEEAGISRIRPVSEDIYSLEVLAVDGHEKKGEYVTSHLHLNVTYLLEADDSEELRVKEDENSAVAWFTPEEALAKSSEPWFVKRIYMKLISGEKN